MLEWYPFGFSNKSARNQCAQRPDQHLFTVLDRQMAQLYTIVPAGIIRLAGVGVMAGMGDKEHEHVALSTSEFSDNNCRLGQPEAHGITTFDLFLPLFR